MKFAGIILLFFLFCFGFYRATGHDSTKVRKNHNVDTLYIKNYSGKLAVYISSYSKANNISIIEGIHRRILTYKPNEAASFGPGFGYKWIGLDLSFITIGKNDDGLYGKTEKIDLQSHFYMRRFLADLNLQYYKGFYLDSIGVVDSNTIKDTTKIKRPDIYQFSVGGSFMYLTNYRRCSMKSTFSQTEVQKKSAGTWAFGVYYHLFAAAGDSSFIPQSVKSYYDSSAYFHGVISSNIGIIGGYMHTFILHKWFLTLSLLPGVARNGYKFVLSGDTAVRRDVSRLSGRVQTRIGIGYNARRTYAVITAIFDGYDFNNSSKSYIKQQYGVVRVYFGYRFISKINKA